MEDYTIVMNEYVHINHSAQHGGVWTVEYEPLEHIPVLEGSLSGTIYDGLCTAAFEALENGSIIGAYGILIRDTGIIVLCYYKEPKTENYLRVSYEAGEVEELTKSFWLQEGF